MVRVVIPEPATKLGKRILEAYPNMERTTSLGKKDKYAFIGTDVSLLDFALLDGLTLAEQHWSWGRLRIGGAIVGTTERCPLSWFAVSESPWMFMKESWIMGSGIHKGATMFLAKTLQRAGVHVGHQQYGRDGIVSGALAVMVHPEGTRCTHQIRYPLKVVESLICKILRIVRGYPNEFFKLWEGESRLHAAMRYWLLIDDMVRSRGLWTYQVEQIDQHWDEICERLGIVKRPLPQVKKTVNARTWEIPPLTWETMMDEDAELGSEIRERAIGYGYEV